MQRTGERRNGGLGEGVGGRNKKIGEPGKGEGGEGDMNLRGYRD